MSLFDRIKNKNLQEKKRKDDLTSSPRVKATGDILKSGSKPTASQKQTADNVLGNLNRFFTDQPDSKTLRTKTTGDEGQFKSSKVKFDSGAKGKFVSGSPDLGGTQRKFVKDRRRKLDVEINKRRSAELTRSDAINRSMGGGPSTEGTGGANQGSTPLKKGKPFSKAESDAIQTRSLNKKTKQFVNKPGTTKSKGGGAITGGEKNLVVNPKSKGTTPVKVNVTKPIKQSEVSKKAKKFTQNINQKNINRSEFSQNLKKIKGTKTGKPISTGDIGFTAPDRKTKVAKRTTRAIKQGTPDPFKIDTSKAAKETAKTFGTKPVKGGLDMGKSTIPTKKPPIKLTKPSDVTPPKSFTDFSKKIKAYKEIEKKVNKPSYNIKSSSASSGGSSSSSDGGRRIDKKFSQGNTSNQTSGGFSGGGKPPKKPSGGGSLVPPGGGSGGSGGVDPDGVFKGKIPNKGGMSNKQFKKFRKDQKKMFKKFMKQAKGAQTNASNVYNVGRRSRTGFEAINLAKKIGKKRAGPLKRAAGFLARKAVKHPVGAAIVGTAALGTAALGIYGAKRKFLPNVKKENDIYKNSTIVGKVTYAKGKRAGQPVLVSRNDKTNPPGISKSQRKGFFTRYRKDDPKTQRNIHKGIMSGNLNVVKNGKVQKIVGGDGKYKIAK